MTRPGRSPRPARPATWASSWKVRSAARKSGKLSDRVGEHHADQRHARHVVPLGDHLRADEDVEAAGAARRASNVCWLPLRRVVSRSMRATRAPGNRWRSSASSCSVPTPHSISAGSRQLRAAPAAAEWCGRSSGSAPPASADGR